MSQCPPGVMYIVYENLTYAKHYCVSRARTLWLQVSKLLSEPRVLDEATSRMVRAQCLQGFDLRASVVEVALRYEGLADVATAHRATQISTGVEVLELHAPLARTLGLGAIADELETQAFRVMT